MVEHPRTTQHAKIATSLFHVPPMQRGETARLGDLEVREFIKDTRPKTITTRGGRKAHRPTPKTRTIYTPATVLPDR